MLHFVYQLIFTFVGLISVQEEFIITVLTHKFDESSESKPDSTVAGYKTNTMC